MAEMVELIPGEAAERTFRRSLRRAASALALLLAIVPWGCADNSRGGPLDPTPGASVILISLDTLRADHLSCYGYGRETSPHIDALAAESVLFERASANSNSTAPSHMTMLTGVLPDVHGVGSDFANSLSPSLPFLPALLAEGGYQTVAFADGGQLSPALGFQRGFAHFESQFERFRTKLGRVDEFLARRVREPTFLFVHTYATHAPYIPEPEHDVYTDPGCNGVLRERVAGAYRMLEEIDASGSSKAQDAEAQAISQVMSGLSYKDLGEQDARYVVDLYDGCVQSADAGVGRLLESLDQNGWLERAWVILTSDHGEAFNEHGTFTHEQLHQAELHVPLIVRPPGGLPGGRRVDSQVRLADILPTILHALALPIPGAIQGRSVLPLDSLTAGPVLAVAGNEPDSDAVVQAGWKLILKRGRPESLYDLRADPAEITDLADAVAVRAEQGKLFQTWSALVEECRALREALGDPARADEFDAAEIDQLKALGYLK